MSMDIYLSIYILVLDLYIYIPLLEYLYRCVAISIHLAVGGELSSSSGPCPQLRRQPPARRGEGPRGPRQLALRPRRCEQPRSERPGRRRACLWDGGGEIIPHCEEGAKAGLSRLVRRGRPAKLLWTRSFVVLGGLEKRSTTKRTEIIWRLFTGAFHRRAGPPCCLGCCCIWQGDWKGKLIMSLLILMVSILVPILPSSTLSVILRHACMTNQEHILQ